LSGAILAGKFKVGRLLGRGGFGATYLAWDIGLRVRIAVKEFLPRQLAARAGAATEVTAFSGSEDVFNAAVQHFLSEARTLARFRDHPGIISVLDFFPENGTGYMVMEYLEGATLEHHAVGRLDVAVALRLIAPVAEALRACHAVGLIHRDISPDAIFLTDDGRVKLVNFGSPRFAAGTLSSDLPVVLKDGYAPIEQYQRNGRQGPWTDLYALTTTLYRLLTGNRPVTAPDRNAGTKLPNPAEAGIEVSPPLQLLLNKGMAIRPEQRYPTTDAFLADLKAAVAASAAAWEEAGSPSHPGPRDHHALPMPDRIGNYQVKSLLARTATGVIYKAWDADIARWVAVKAIPLAMLEDNDANEALDRFRHGVQAAGRLSHPGVVSVCDYGETDDCAYIVMEFVDGPTLKQRLDAGERFGAAALSGIMDEILQALQYSHAHGVVHRDVKPANIMFTADQRVKITDFGIARVHDVNATQTGVVIGSPAYMAPEQFVGEKIDWRCDIYATGVMLYQMVTGSRPYEGSLHTIAGKVTQSPVPRASRIAPLATPALDNIVRRAMAKKPDHRFQSAAEFNTALQAVLSPAEPEPVPPNAPVAERALPVGSAPHRPAAGLVAGGIMLVLAASFAISQYWRSAPSRPQPVLSAGKTRGIPANPAPAAPVPAANLPASNAPPNRAEVPVQAGDVQNPTAPRPSDPAASIPAEPKPQGQAVNPPPMQISPGIEHETSRSALSAPALSPTPLPVPPRPPSPASRDASPARSQLADVPPSSKPTGAAQIPRLRSRLNPNRKGRP
jgi:serine/threonine protein kinase